MEIEYTALVVVDDEALNRYERWLEPAFEVAVSTSDGDPGADFEAADVLLLTPPYPRIDRGSVAESVRREDDECLVLIASAFDAAESIVHCSCSESVAPPVDGGTLRETVSQLLERARYDDLLAEYADLAARRGSMEASNSPDTLRASPEYDAIRDRIDVVNAELDSITAGFDASDFAAAFETPDFEGGPRILQAVWSS